MKNQMHRDTRDLDEAAAPEDVEAIAPFVLEYYGWLSGTDPECRGPECILRDVPISERQRRLLLARMDDILVIWGMTADRRNQVEH